MVLVKRVLCFLSLMAIAQSGSASLVIDPFSTALPAAISPVPSPTQVLANADRFLTRTGGGSTTSGNNTLVIPAGASREVSFFYDLRAPVDLTAAGQNYLQFAYSAVTGAGAGSYTATFKVLNAFTPGASVLSQAVVSGLSLAATNADVWVASASFTNVGALASARYLQVSINRNNNANGGTFSFSSALQATATPAPASLILAGLTGISAFVADRRRSNRSAAVGTGS